MDQRHSWEDAIDLRTARYLLTLADVRSFRQAARRLYISEAGLSQAVKAAEAKWGAPFFVRSAHGVALTPFGQSLLPYLRQLCQEADKVAAQLKDWQHQRSQSCRIGVVAFTAARITHILLDLMRRYPEVAFEVHESSTADIVAKTAAGVLDVGFVLGSRRVHYPKRKAGLAVDVVRAGTLMAIGTPLALSSWPSPLTARDLVRLPLIAFLPGYFIRELIEAVLGRPLDHHLVLAGNSALDQLAFCQQGLGIMIVPDFAWMPKLDPSAQRLQAVPIVPDIPIELVAVRPPGIQGTGPVHDALQRLRAG
jgi:DNA-binding transcriptional LysR family regulator